MKVSKGLIATYRKFGYEVLVWSNENKDWYKAPEDTEGDFESLTLYSEEFRKPAIGLYKKEKLENE